MAGGSRVPVHRVLFLILHVLVCLAASAAILLLYFWSDRQHTALLVFAVLVPVLWSVPFYMRLRELLRHRLFTRAEIRCESDRPHLGQTFPVELVVTARRRLVSPALRLQLCAVEEVRPAHGAPRMARPILTAVDLPAPETLEPDRVTTLQTQITLPAHAMQSFEGHSVALRWFLETQYLSGSPVTLALRELSVQPVRENYTPSPDSGEVSEGDLLKITLSRSSFHVGQRAGVSVAVDPAAARDASSCVVCVLWTIADSSPEESRTVFTRSVPDPLHTSSQSFDFIIPPAGPVSYAGQLFSISWSVRAQLLDAQDNVLLTTDLPFSVLPRPA